MSLTIETGAGIAAANAYVDPAGATAATYFAAHAYASAWLTATAEEREAAVGQATRTIDASFDFKGRPATQSQGLKWPRSGVVVDHRTIASNAIPRALQEATLELALALLIRDRSSDTGGAQEATKIGLGDGALELEFAEGTDPAAKPIPIIPEIVARLLRGYGANVGGGAAMVPVVRR